MAEISWQAAVEVVRPYVVRITTPDGTGSGFLFALAAEGGICGIATAAHVLAHAHAWEEPIRVQHFASGATVLLRSRERGIVLDESLDTAAVTFLREEMPFPATLLDLAPSGRALAVGTEIGWVGFPAPAPEHLCFFSGRVSAWLEPDEAYLVDGVAINGVSGGPALFVAADGRVVVGGVVSAYLSNRTGGKNLPGLSVVRHVGQLQEVVHALRSMEESYARQTPPERAAKSAGRREVADTAAGPPPTGGS